MNSLNKTPLITIIVPVYNTKQYLKECLETIRRQTLDRIEIILVNDGSTDGSQSICEEYKHIDNRFSVIHQQNKGLSASRNVAIDKAKGEYILFVDSDDYINIELCQMAYDYAKEKNADLVRFFYQEDTKLGIRFHSKQLTLSQDIIESDIDKLKTAYTSGAMVWKFLISRDILILNNIRFPENLIYEDMYFTTKLALSSRRMVVLHKTLYSYRIRCSSLSWASEGDAVEQCEQCCNLGIKYAKELQVSDVAIDFLSNQRDRMIANLTKRIDNKYNTEYPREVFYE